MAKIEIYAKPSNLYRYRQLGSKLDDEIGALRGGYIFCPLLSEMNDPMEGSHRVSQRFSGGTGDVKRQDAVDAALSVTGIASLSEIFNHEPMWAHYADQFRGMCVQYNMNALIRGLGETVAITRMMYSEQERSFWLIGARLLRRRVTACRARRCGGQVNVNGASFAKDAGKPPTAASRPSRKSSLGRGSRITNSANWWT